MILYKSDIIFDPQAHTYTAPDGRQLSGVTAMLGATIFKDKYNGVPQGVLKEAARRGSNIHHICELLDDLGIRTDNAEANAYKQATASWRYVCSEYLVSDKENIASMIDKVYQTGDGEVLLADIKTTYKLDTEYLSWQLSIYAELFEKQNPNISVAALKGLWLRDGKCEVVDIPRRNAQEVRDLIRAYTTGEVTETMANALAKPDDTLPARFAEAEKAVALITAQLEGLQNKQDELKAGLYKAMEEAGVKKWTGKYITMTRVLPKESVRLDTKRLRKDHPDICAEYETATQSKGYITIKTL